MPPDANCIRWFDDLGLADVPQVGGKNASLGELYRQLADAGVRVPNGFAVTADAYRHFMCAPGLANQGKSSAVALRARPHQVSCVKFTLDTERFSGRGADQRVLRPRRNAGHVIGTRVAPRLHNIAPCSAHWSMRTCWRARPRTSTPGICPYRRTPPETEPS